MATHKISFDEYSALSEIVFEWADSYDAKDWKRLRAQLAPDLKIDYSQLNGKIWDAMPADEFVEMVSGAKMFGDPLLRTQHLVGSSKWEKTSDIEIFGLHQVRSGSLRSNGANKEDAVFESHRTLIVQHWYRKVDDVWKLAGIKPLSR